MQNDPATVTDERCGTGITAPSVCPDATPGAHPASNADRYVLRDEIARGGMGVVYRATDTILDREVAVKVLQERFETGSAVARRFIDEARITGQLQHPGIPAVHDLGTLPDDRPFLAMKLIRGLTLDDLLRDRSDLTADRGRLVGAFEQVCQAVGYAHAHGVIHRDLKPANVMVGSFGEVQVMDWGLAKVLTSRPREQPTAAPEETTAETAIRSLRESDGSETQAGSILGTPAFMPPEQAAGAVHLIDERSDVFGLGAILAMILSGQPPFVGQTAEDVRVLSARGKVEECFARLDGCGADPDLVALCKKCLAAEKAERPANGGVVAQAVAALRAAADERARQAELDRVRVEGERAKAEAEAREQRKRRRVQLALATVLGLSVVAGGAFTWWQDRQVTQRRAEEHDRATRNAEALANLLSGCNDSLRAGDAERAAALLGEAERRLPEGGSDELRGRFEACRTDLAMLRELEAFDQFRWTSVEDKFPDWEDQAIRLRAAFERFGLASDQTPPDEAARRMAGSTVRDRLVLALDLWLLADSSPKGSAEVRALLKAVDANNYRDAVRDAILARDFGRVARLAEQEEALSQPSGFAGFLGGIKGVPVERQREVLRSALLHGPGDLGLLLNMGWTYPIDARPESVAGKLRWCQAAVAAQPRNVSAHTSLASALTLNGDTEGAVAEYQAAIRLDPKSATLHTYLGMTLFNDGDTDKGIAQCREALEIDPKFAFAHHWLGAMLQRKGDLDGAIAEYKEAIRLDPGYGVSHVGVGLALREKGDLDGAIVEYKEAMRVNPNLRQSVERELARVERWQKDLLPRLPDIAAGKTEPKSSAEALDFAWLCRQPFQRRYATAAGLYEKAFGAEPKLVDDLLAGHRYNAACYAARAARGDGVDAPADPADRAALRAKALAWLREDLALFRKQLANSTDSRLIVGRLTQRIKDPDLAAVRDPEALAKLSTIEREEWEKLWADVKATRADAQKPAGTK
jgi:tetratricopeptide (TPR) repeat protein